MAALLEVSDLHKQYGGKRALAGVSLSLGPGTIVGLLGPNGSGKSTLLKIIAGLVKPTSGSVTVLGRRPGMLTKADTAYLPEVDCLYPEMSVAGALRFVSTFYRDWDEAKALELLRFMELAAPAPVSSLSRGMRARLKLVLALARRSPLVLLDEPLSGIDPLSRARIVQAIVGQYRPQEGSIIISTHEVIQAESAFDEVVFLDQGQIKLTGNADELREARGLSLEALFEEVYA